MRGNNKPVTIEDAIILQNKVAALYQEHAGKKGREGFLKKLLPKSKQPDEKSEKKEEEPEENDIEANISSKADSESNTTPPQDEEEEGPFSPLSSQERANESSECIS